MTLVPGRRAIDLKRLEACPKALERFLAALRCQGKERWASPFAASGAKPPPFAPPRR